MITKPFFLAFCCGRVKNQRLDMAINHCFREKHETDDDRKIDIHKQQKDFPFPVSSSLSYPYCDPYNYPDGWVLINMEVDTTNTYGNKVFPGNFSRIRISSFNSSCDFWRNLEEFTRIDKLHLIFIYIGTLTIIGRWIPFLEHPVQEHFVNCFAIYSYRWRCRRRGTPRGPRPPPSRG